jgi:DNA sulfur modification protein DndD
MKLLELTMMNFMPYAGTTALLFPSDINKNVLVILGDNMRGKTSLMNALRWGFYGRALDRYSSDIPLHLLANKESSERGDWNFEVAIKYEADGKQCELRRRATKKMVVGRPLRDQDFDVQVSLKEGGQISHLDSDIRLRINQVCPEQTSRFFLFDGELLQEYESLLREDDEQGERIKEAIEQILGVPAITRGREQVQVLLKEAQKAQQHEVKHNSALEKSAEAQRVLLEFADRIESDHKVANEKLLKFKTQASDLKGRIDQTESAYKQKIELVEKEKSNDDLEKDISNLQIEKLSVIKESWRDLLQPKVAVAKAHLHEILGEGNERQNRKVRTAARIEEIRRILAESSCTLCEQPVDASLRDRLGARLGQLESEMDKESLDSSKLFDARQRLQLLDRIASTNAAEALNRVANAISTKSIKKQRNSNDIERLKKELEAFDTAEIARERALYEQRLKDIGAAEKEIEKIVASREDNRRRREAYAKQLQSDASTRKMRVTALVDTYTSLEHIFTSSIDRLRDGLREKVEGLASEAFRAMTTDKSYSGLSINKGYGLTILDEDEEEVEIRSAGAEQVVALSLIDGLNRTGQRAGPVVMDTPFGRLDPRHRANVLSYLAESASQLILFVHEGEISVPQDLQSIATRVSGIYEIARVTSRHSRLERRT